jgi:hypothetical protein
MYFQGAPYRIGPPENDQTGLGPPGGIDRTQGDMPKA